MKSSHAPNPSIRTHGQRNAKGLLLTCLVVITTCGLSNIAMSSSLLGPFIPGSGNLSILSGATFDSESQVLEWMGSGKYPGMIGRFLFSSERAFRASGSIQSSNVCSKVTPRVFRLRKSVDVEVNKPYVLSAFFYTEKTKGRAFIDVEDRTVTFDYGPGADVA